MSLGKGIKLSSGFDLNSKTPIDSRTVFENMEERDQLPDINRYEGLICYVKSKKINYQIIDGIWQELKVSLSESNLGNVDKDYVDAELEKKAEKDHGHSYSDLDDKPFIPNSLSDMVNDTGFITIEDIDTSKEHEHTNKDAIDLLTVDKMNVWDNKSDFDGDYNSLTNIPKMPVVDVDKKYVDEGLEKKSNLGHGHNYTELTGTPHIPTKTSEMINDSGFITANDIDTSQNHIHQNIDTLNRLSQDMMNRWDNKSDFNGDYNSLLNKPIIPTIDVDKEYVDSNLQKTYDNLKSEVDGKADEGHIHFSEALGYSNESDTSITTVKDALDKLLYFNLVINLSSNQSTTVEKGRALNDVRFQWSYNKSVASQTFNGEVLEKDIREYIYNPFLSEGKTFTLQANDGKNSFNKSLTFIFLNGRYWGVSEPKVYDSEFIKSMSSKELSSNRNKTFTVNCGVDEYIYYCIPSSFGLPTFTVGGFAGGFEKISSIEFVNTYNHIETYDIWKSVNSNLGSTTVVVS